MHTEVDVLNTDRTLMPGLYAEAVLTLEERIARWPCRYKP